jgi:hypothetical protein
MAQSCVNAICLELRPQGGADGLGTVFELSPNGSGGWKIPAALSRLANVYNRVGEGSGVARALPARYSSNF